MTTHDRDQFIVTATQEGLPLDVARKLMRYATTLHRLAEAQCNGDWPYNGDRDRPDIGMVDSCAWWDARYATCPKCQASGVAKSAMRWSLIPAGAGYERAKVCPDCRTQELVTELLADAHTGHSHAPMCPSRVSGPCECRPDVSPIFQGDPRGAVLLLSTPNHPWTEDGRGRGIYVPAR